MATDLGFCLRRLRAEGTSLSKRWLSGFKPTRQESAHPEEPGHTFTPENPLVIDWDWPFRRIDYLFVRCGAHGGPTLAIASCERIFDPPVQGVWASDHFGLVADLQPPT